VAGIFGCTDNVRYKDTSTARVTRISSTSVIIVACNRGVNTRRINRTIWVARVSSACILIITVYFGVNTSLGIRAIYSTTRVLERADIDGIYATNGIITSVSGARVTIIAVNGSVGTSRVRITSISSTGITIITANC